MSLFRHVDYLFWGALIFVLILALHAKTAHERRHQLKSIFADKNFGRISDSYTLKARKIKDILFLMTLFFTLLSIAGPQWGTEFAPIGESSGNLVIAVDTSLSMLARDLKPSRMENAKLMLKSLLDYFKDSRIGIIAFSGKAYTQCPLTLDGDAVKYFISVLSAGMVPGKGTNIAQAIEKSVNTLKHVADEKTVIILTDGEDFSENLEDTIKYSVKNKTRIFTVGIGSVEGELIPITNKKGKVIEYKKDKNGKTVVTRLNEKVLVYAAERTNGAYIRYSNPETVARKIYNAVQKKGGFSEAAARSAYKNRYQIFLIFAFILLICEIFIPERRLAWHDAKKVFSAMKK